jgi:hypothetical protein
MPWLALEQQQQEEDAVVRQEPLRFGARFVRKLEMTWQHRFYVYCN